MAKGGDWSLFDNLDRNWLADNSSMGREDMEAEWMYLTAFTAVFLGGSAPAYPYRRAAEVVVPRPGEGVGSGDRMPVRGDGGDGGGKTSTVTVSVVRILWRRVGKNYEEVKQREDKHR